MKIIFSFVLILFLLEPHFVSHYRGGAHSSFYKLIIVICIPKFTFFFILYGLWSSCNFIHCHSSPLFVTESEGINKGDHDDGSSSLLFVIRLLVT